MQKRRQIAGFIVCCVVAFAAAAVGSIASIRAAEFYGTLVRPGWAPPASIFGPIWTILYSCMAIASWLVWRESRPGRWSALTAYVAQLILNALWPWLFFAWRQGRWAFIEIFVLWFVLAATIWLFWRIRRVAAMLLIPYLLWVSFASLLAFEVWRTNPGVLSENVHCVVPGLTETALAMTRRQPSCQTVERY